MGNENKDQTSGRFKSRPTVSKNQDIKVVKPKKRGSGDEKLTSTRDKKRARIADENDKANLDEEVDDVQDNSGQEGQPGPEQFEEDGNFIEMGVNAEEDDFESESEDREIADDSDSRDVSQSESELEKYTGTDTSASGEEEADSSPVHKRKIKKRKKNNKRMEAKIDNLSNALMAMQNMMVQKGILGQEHSKTESKKGDRAQDTSVLNTNSETTIYENAVNKECESIKIDGGEIILNLNKNKQVLQNSSDEQADTSDELINVTEQFIADCTAEAECRRSLETSFSRQQEVQQPQAEKRGLPDMKMHGVSAYWNITKTL